MSQTRFDSALKYAAYRDINKALFEGGVIDKKTYDSLEAHVNRLEKRSVRCAEKKAEKPSRSVTVIEPADVAKE